MAATLKNEDGSVEVLAVDTPENDSEPEIYYLLRTPPDDPADVRCSVESVEIRGWNPVPVEDVTVLERSPGPDSVSYVC